MHDMDMNHPPGLTIFGPILILGSLPLALAILLRAGGSIVAFLRPRVAWRLDESGNEAIRNVATMQNIENQVLEA
jgi:hypothetical protein